MVQVKPKPDKTGVDKQMWNVGLLVISLIAKYGGTEAKIELREKKKLIMDLIQVYEKGASMELRFTIKMIRELWTDDYVITAVAYVRLLSKKLIGEDIAIKLSEQTAPTQKEIDAPKERIFNNKPSLTKKQLEDIS